MAKLMFRHGDVLLTEVTGINVPAEVKPGKQAVLAEGEVTGHHHVITCERPVIADWVLDLHRYVKLDAPCILDHPEHGEINVPAGTFEVKIGRAHV